MSIHVSNYAETTRLIYGEPNLPTGSRVWVRQKSGTRRTGVRYLVVVDRPGDDRSDVQCLYWCDEDALVNASKP